MPYEKNEGFNVLQPACRHLLSKGMFVSGTLDPVNEDYEMGDGNCWCAKTQNALGPDRDIVERENCQPNRTCYEPRL